MGKDSEGDSDSKADLKKLISSLLWEMVHQREKVPCTLDVILERIYPSYPPDARREIKKKVLANIKGCEPWVPNA